MTRPLSLSLYNTLSRRLEPVTPSREGHVRIYCCGPTPYDVSHGGHGRSALLPDLLVRHLRAEGVTVKYVRNITDVEDKILKRSKEAGEDPLALAERFTKMYQEDLARLGCLPPDEEPRVSQSIGDIAALIQTLIDRGAAYEVATETGKDVWYSVRSFEGYGKLSGRSIDDLRAGEGLKDRATAKAVHADKRDPLDFALWKSAPEGEWAFDSPWGRGRPGWHIECSAMCERHLGFGFEVHTGGMDLVFPHHENEIAQSEAARPGEGPFARHWLHNGFLTVDKEKMAKSLGNFVTMRDCYARNDPEALRYFFLSAQYRAPLDFEAVKLDSGRVVFPAVSEAEAQVDYLYTTVERLSALAASAPKGGGPDHKELAKSAELVRGTRARVTRALNDDLNSPVALAAIHELATASNLLADLAQRRKKDSDFAGAAARLAGEAAAALLASGRVLGLLELEPGAYAARTRVQRLGLLGLEARAIEQKVQERRQARASKDFARSDAIRKELEELGVEVFDSPTGTTWRLGIKRASPAPTAS